MEDKTYTVSMTCPHCGETTKSTHSAEEMAEKHGESKTAAATCPRCRQPFEQSMHSACLEWDDACQMEMSRFG